MARAIIFEKPNSATLIDRDAEALREGYIRIESELSLVSAGTERTQFTKGPNFPLEPGYATVGHVTAVGSGAPGFKVGDRIFAQMGHASEATIDHRFAVSIPDNVRSEDAAFAAVGAMAVYTVRLAGFRFGDPLLILGQGLIGLIATQVARVAGAIPITVVDLSEKRLELATILGADRTFLASDPGLGDWLKTLPGGGPASTIELSAACAAADTAVAYTRRGGRIVTGSLIPAGHDVNVFGRVWLEGISIVGAYFNSRPWQIDATETTSPYDWPVRLYDGGWYPQDEISTGRSDFAIFLRLLECGRLRVSDLVHEIVDADEAPEMFARLPLADTLGHIIRWR